MNSDGNKMFIVAVFFLTLIISARSYANDSEINPNELSKVDVAIYSEKVQLPMEGLITLAGALFNSETLRGKYVLVNLWASWCPDCRREKPSIERLYMELSNGRLFGNEELVLLTVSLGEDPDTVKSYMEKNQYSFPVVLDRENKLRAAFASWVPTSYVLDPDGNIIARIIREDEWDGEQALRTLKRLVSITFAQ